MRKVIYILILVSSISMITLTIDSELSIASAEEAASHPIVTGDFFYQGAYESSFDFVSNLVLSESDGKFYAVVNMYNPTVIQVDSDSRDIVSIGKIDGEYLGHRIYISADNRTLYVLVNEYDLSTASIYAVDLATGASSPVFTNDNVSGFILAPDDHLLVSYAQKIELVSIETQTIIQSLDINDISPHSDAIIGNVQVFNETIVADVLPTGLFGTSPIDLVFLTDSPILTTTKTISSYNQFVAQTTQHTIVQSSTDWVWLDAITLSEVATVPIVNSQSSKLYVDTDELIINVSTANSLSFQTIELDDPTNIETFDLTGSAIAGLESAFRVPNGDWLVHDFATLHALTPIASQLSIPAMFNNYCSTVIKNSFADPNTSWLTDPPRVTREIDNGNYLVTLQPDSAAGPLSPHPITRNTFIRVLGERYSTGVEDSLWGLALIAENNDAYLLLVNIHFQAVLALHLPATGGSTLITEIEDLSHLYGLIAFSAEIRADESVRLAIAADGGDERDIVTIEPTAPIVASGVAVFTNETAVKIIYRGFQQTNIGCADQLPWGNSNNP